MKVREGRTACRAEDTFSALLEKLGDQIQLSKGPSQIASASNSLSHSHTSPTMYCSQPDVDINYYSTMPIDTKSKAVKADISNNQSSVLSPSGTSSAYYSESSDISSTEAYYSTNESYSYYSNSTSEYTLDISDYSTLPYPSNSNKAASPLSKQLLKEIIHDNPHLQSKLHAKQNPRNTSLRGLEPTGYKLSVSEMRQIKALGEDLVAAAQTALQDEARRQREASKRLSQPKRPRTSQGSPKRAPTPRYDSIFAKPTKRKKPAVVLEVPQIEQNGYSTIMSAHKQDHKIGDITVVSSRSAQTVDQMTITENCFQYSSSEELTSDAQVLTQIKRDYVQVPQSSIREYSPHRVSIPGPLSGLSSSVPVTNNDTEITKGSVTSVATPQELLASVILAGSIPDIHSNVEAATVNSKQPVPSKSNNNFMTKKKGGKLSVSAGHQSKPLSSSALDFSGELPEPASHLLLTKNSSIQNSNPLTDLTLTATVPRSINNSTHNQPRSSIALSQQLQVTKTQTERTIKELKEKINALEHQLRNEKQRNVSTTKELRTLRERKRVLEVQLKRELEERDATIWEAQKKALKMNISLIKTISAMSTSQGDAKQGKPRPHRRIPSHMHHSQIPKSLGSSQPSVSNDTPLTEVAPPISKNPQLIEEPTIDPVPLSDNVELSIQADEIIICSRQMQAEPPTNTTDLNKVFLDTCNRTIRDALADVCSPNSTAIPVFTSTDPPTLNTETTPPPPIAPSDHEAESIFNRQDLLISDISPEVTINRMDQPAKGSNGYLKEDKILFPTCNVPIDKQLFQKNPHKNASLVLGKQKDETLKPPAAPPHEHRPRSIKRFGECVALFLLPSPTQYPADVLEITKLIISISTDISSVPGFAFNERQYMNENLRLVRELVERLDLSIFNYPLFTAKLIAAMFCAYGSTSFSVYSTIIYRISDLLVAEIANSSSSSSNEQLYEIECKLYIHILSIIRGVCLLTTDIVAHTDLQPGENSFQVISLAFGNLDMFVLSSSVMLENTALYLVISLSIELLLSNSLKNTSNLLSLSATPTIGKDNQRYHTENPISQLEYTGLQDMITKTIGGLCDQLLATADDDCQDLTARYHPNHTLCSISSLLYSIVILLQCKELSTCNSTLLARQKRRILGAIPSLDIVPHT